MSSLRSLQLRRLGVATVLIFLSLVLVVYLTFTLLSAISRVCSKQTMLSAACWDSVSELLIECPAPLGSSYPKTGVSDMDLELPLKPRAEEVINTLYPRGATDSKPSSLIGNMVCPTPPYY